MCVNPDSICRLLATNRTFWNALTTAHVHLYRTSGGRLGGRTFGARILLLDHVGRKSGKRRTSPLIHVVDGDRLAIVASNGGSRRHPAWWLNLREQPETTVQVGGERRRVHAREAEGAERERLWERAVAAYAPYRTYARRTERRIPVVVLEPAAQ